MADVALGFSPILFQKKKDGLLHLRVGHRGLNRVCMENIYPLPPMKDILTYLAKEQGFC